MTEIMSLPFVEAVFILVAVLGGFFALSKWWQRREDAMRRELNDAMGSVRREIKESGREQDNFRLEVVRDFAMKAELKEMMREINQRFDVHERNTAAAIDKIERHFSDHFMSFTQQISALLGKNGNNKQ